MQSIALKTLLTVLLCTLTVSSQQLQKVDVKLDWHAPVGFETNGIYNLRYPEQGSLMSDWRTWALLAAVTNSTSHWLYGTWETTLWSVTHTNPLTGVESAEGISPVTSQAYARTNAVSVRVEPAPLETKQSLQIWWNGPLNWQANGGMFNVRCSGPGSDISNYLTWPVAARVTNILNTKFYNVNPTQWYSISFTNKLTGFETTEGIPPVRAQYNWQGLTNTTVRMEREYQGWQLGKR